MNQWSIAAIWVGLALVAGLISFRTAISVSLLEIALGIFGGNFLDLHATEWINFLAGFGAILLTFLAGAEIEPAILRKHLKASLAIGFVSFFFPFVGAWIFALHVAGWDPRAAQIAGIALSCTSVAVVYAVMVETGLNRTELGKLILAACFITDFGTVLALGILFANYDIGSIIFIVVTTFVLALLPKFSNWFFRSFSGKVSELEARFIFMLLFFLGGMAVSTGSEAVLPAYVMGLVLAGLFAQHQDMVRRLRMIVFGFLTPFYFLKAGMLVSLPAVWAGAGLILVLLVVKVTTKTCGVFPLTRIFRIPTREGTYTTLLMSTGLTFGTIAALFGFQHELINQTEYTILTTVIIASAVVPTLIAQAFFKPNLASDASPFDESSIPQFSEIDDATVKA